MKLPNGFGSVYKLSGKRRNPYIARKTNGWEIDQSTGKAKQQYITIGYYPSRQEALSALVNYNENPYDIDVNNITFVQVYERWSEKHFKTIVPSAARTWKAAFTYCAPLHKMKMKDIRANHLEETILNAEIGDSTKGRMKSLFNMMYKYAMKNEIVQKDYSALCDAIKRPKPQIIRVPFSDEEIKILWDNLIFPFVDMVLVGIYTGFRPQELALLQVDNINFEDLTIIGGIKTDAGRNRVVPIHPLIKDTILKNYNYALSLNSKHLFNDENGQQGTYLTYDKYRGRFNKIVKKFNMAHKPHDTRHTFITKAKNAQMDEYILKLIVGHQIEDITEKTYTHRTIMDLHKEIEKIKN